MNDEDVRHVHGTVSMLPDGNVRWSLVSRRFPRLFSSRLLRRGFRSPLPEPFWLIPNGAIVDAALRTDFHGPAFCARRVGFGGRPARRSRLGDGRAGHVDWGVPRRRGPVRCARSLARAPDLSADSQGTCPRRDVAVAGGVRAESGERGVSNSTLFGGVRRVLRGTSWSSTRCCAVR